MAEKKSRQVHSVWDQTVSGTKKGQHAKEVKVTTETLRQLLENIESRSKAAADKSESSANIEALRTLYI